MTVVFQEYKGKLTNMGIMGVYEDEAKVSILPPYKGTLELHHILWKETMGLTNAGNIRFTCVIR